MSKLTIDKKVYTGNQIIELFGSMLADALKKLSHMPSAEPVIIRCKDCKYYEIAWLKADGTDDKRYKPSVCVNGKYGETRKPDWFCADAERKQDE